MGSPPAPTPSPSTSSILPAAPGLNLTVTGDNAALAGADARGHQLRRGPLPAPSPMPPASPPSTICPTAPTPSTPSRPATGPARSAQRQRRQRSGEPGSGLRCDRPDRDDLHPAHLPGDRRLPGSTPTIRRTRTSSSSRSIWPSVPTQEPLALSGFTAGGGIYEPVVHRRRRRWRGLRRLHHRRQLRRVPVGAVRR